MEPITELSFDSAGRRPVGWQLQLRVDSVVEHVTQTHRGQPEERIIEAIHEELRGLGVVPNRRQVQHHAAIIARLPAQGR
jgi:hypothetical protein